jgi:peptidyl-tRNA hydrolase
MDIPRFDIANINPRLALSGIGDAFQEFVHQVLLPEFPQLHRFPSGGKDGAIDLIDTSDGCHVVECKFVGEDDYAAIERRWIAVRNLLDKHLREPTGPTLGQSQYAPWYSSTSPITEYKICFSAVISNEQQRRTLKNAIEDFFRDLATQRSHLAHLQKLNVEIVDWSDLATRIQKQPHLIFRWFPGARPSGLVPLDEDLDVGTFRAYLTSAKLPYYSLAEHLRSVSPPAGATILDEETLLNHFDNPQTTGLIISGKGGVGKSRLTLELGWLGLRRGWSVMRVQSRLKEDALERFVERLSPDQSALFLVDYIETQSDFGELVESINVLNDSGVARLRYVAACRSNYYHKVIATSERHLPVNLTPPPGSAVQDWFAGYRQKTIEKILSKAGLPTTDEYLRICHNMPILAVFLAYLHTSGRSDDLAELLDETEFGNWILKRIQLTFRERSISRELAQLIPQFPMEDSTARELPKSVYRSIFDSLATDGWVEKLHASAMESTENWVTGHDVLADQMLLSYVRSIPDTLEAFIAELFELSSNMQSLTSALISLQRVSDVVPMNTVNWRNLISEAITKKEGPWHDVRNLLIRTTLLSEPDQLSFLHTHNELWQDAESDSGFQKSLGWLARWIVKYRQAAIPEHDKDALISWIAKAAPLADRGNFVITWGLRLAPEVLRDTALSWITTKPALFQTHYLMVAWLDTGLPPSAIASSVQKWCVKFSQSFHLTFLSKAWLDAGGDKAVVEAAIKNWLVEHRREAEAQFVYNAWLDGDGDRAVVEAAIKDWLVEHGREAEAEFVYKAWLDAGGDRGVVEEAINDWLVDHRREAEARFIYDAWLDAGGEKTVVEAAINDWLGEHRRKIEAQFVYKSWLDAGGEQAVVEAAIKDWLVEHRREAEARFVYQAWLEAGGKRELVWDAAIAWLSQHRAEESAGYVTKFIAKQPNLSANTVKDVLTWCRTFPKNEDALWRLTQLRDNLFVNGIADDLVSTAEAVLLPLFPATTKPGRTTRAQVAALLFTLITSEDIQSNSLRERVNSLFLSWLNHPLSFGRDPHLFWTIQHAGFIERIALLIKSGALDPTSDRESLVRFLEWVDEWSADAKQRARLTLDVMKSNYPSDLWNIVRFD